MSLCAQQAACRLNVDKVLSQRCLSSRSFSLVNVALANQGTKIALPTASYFTDGRRPNIEDLCRKMVFTDSRRFTYAMLNGESDCRGFTEVPRGPNGNGNGAKRELFYNDGSCGNVLSGCIVVPRLI